MVQPPTEQRHPAARHIRARRFFFTEWMRPAVPLPPPSPTDALSLAWQFLMPSFFLSGDDEFGAFGKMIFATGHCVQGGGGWLEFLEEGGSVAPEGRAGDDC